MSNKQDNSGNLPSAALPLHNQAEEALHEPKQFLKSVIDGLPDIIAVLDDQGNILLTNKSYRVFAEKNGVKPGTFSNSTNYLSVCDSASGEDSEEASLFAKGIRDVLSGKCQLFELEYPCHSPDEKRWFIGRVSPLTYQGSRQVIVAHTNITVLKQTEEALRRSQELLNSTKRLSKTGGWEWDTVTQAMIWTEETYRIHGFMPGEMEPGSAEHINRSLACYGPEARPIILGAFQRCVEQGESYDLELPFTSAKGSQLWVRTTAHPVLESGKVVRVIGNIVDITELKRRENELRIAQELSDRIIEDGPVAITIMNRNGKIVFSNRHAEQLFGLEKTTIEALGYNDFRWQITDVDGSVFADERLPFCQVMATGKAVYDIQYAIAPPDGARKILSINAAPLHDEQGRIDRVVCSIQDITERRQAEEHLQKFKQIVSSTSEAVSLVDKNYCYVITNKAYETFSGKKQEEFIGLSVADYLGEAVFLEHVRPQFDRCLKGETISYQDWFEYPRLGKRFVEVTYFPYIDVKGDIAGVVSNTRDITDLKNAEREVNTLLEKRVAEKTRELLDSRNLFQTLADYAPVGIFQTNAEGRNTFVNKKWCEITGVPEASALDGGWLSALHDEDRTRVVDAWIAAVDEGKEFYAEYRFVHPDGNVVVVQGNAVAVHKKDSGSRHYIGCIVDITERQMATEEIIKVKEMAISADQEKDRLMRTVAHEFRTPLSLITSSFDILDRYGDNLDEQRRKAQDQHIRSAVRQLTELVKTLLSYNQRENSQDLELWTLQDIEKLIRIICEEVTSGRSSGQSLQLSFPVGHGVVKMNEAIFRCLFGNIVDNACHYSLPAGCVFVRVSIEEPWLILEVQDQGIGILPEDRERVFDDFYRGQNAARQRGMGLGLGIARYAAERLGGIIDLANFPSQGTTFRIKLPFSSQ